LKRRSAKEKKKTRARMRAKVAIKEEGRRVKRKDMD